MLKRHKSIIILATVITATSIIAFGEVNKNVQLENVTLKSSVKTTRINSTLVTKEPDGVATSQEISRSDVLVSENTKYKLYIDTDSLIIKQVDKSNNYVWSSTLTKDKLDTLNFEWQRMAQSLLTAEFINPAGGIMLSPLKHDQAKKPIININKNGFSAKVEFYEAKVELTVIVELTDKGIKVNIPDDSIKELGNNKLNKIYIMPFFGATRSDDVPGYMFIPDGSGALIRYSKPKNYLTSFNGRVYGEDIGMIRNENLNADSLQTDKMQLSMPVFGAVHGKDQNAFLAVAEKGDAYMEIEASPAGATIDSNWVCAKFIYREQYTQPTSKSGGAFTTVQSKMNKVDATVEYVMLNGSEANYVGMAKAYRKMLKKDGSLVDKSIHESAIKLNIEAIMAEPTKGLFSDKTQIMTKISDVNSWSKELEKKEIPHSLVLWGIEDKGINGHKLNTLKIDKNIGTDNSLGELYKQMKDKGNDLILRKEIMTGYDNQIKKNQIAFHIDGGLIGTEEIYKPLYTQRYFQKVAVMNEFINKIDNTPDYYNKIALSTIGNNLYSDFNRNNKIYRDSMMVEIEKTLENANNKSDKLALYEPNAYALKNADVIFNIPMNNSSYIYETDSVPFIQTVLSGNIDYYAPYLNFGTNTTEEILRLIDYNAYPSYMLTEEYTNKLAKTNLNDVYSTRYNDLKPYILKTYKIVSSVLNEVKGKEIVDRIIPQDNISITIYEGNVVVIVNYSDKSYTYKNVTVESLSAKAIKE